jgi:hypothetical protein
VLVFKRENLQFSGILKRLWIEEKTSAGSRKKNMASNGTLVHTGLHRKATDKDVYNNMNMVNV